MTTDTISDMLTRIRNANLARHQIVQIPSTKITRNIAQVLFSEGLIDSFDFINIISEIEKEFKVKISINKIDAKTTINNLKNEFK